MKVYSVLLGEKHEGGHIRGIYATRGKAVDAALKIPFCFEGGWFKTAEKDVWENGCDFVQIQEWKVKE